MTKHYETAKCPTAGEDDSIIIGEHTSKVCSAYHALQSSSSDPVPVKAVPLMEGEGLIKNELLDQDRPTSIQVLPLEPYGPRTRPRNSAWLASYDVQR